MGRSFRTFRWKWGNGTYERVVFIKKGSNFNQNFFMFGSTDLVVLKINANLALDCEKREKVTMLVLIFLHLH